MNKYILSSNYILQNVGEDIVLLPCGLENEVDLSKMIVLNETGAFIVSCIENSFVSYEHLLEYVTDKFEVTSENIKEDLTDFLNELESKGIICQEK